MNDAMLQVRIDSELKKNAEQLFESIGITFADAVRMFAIQAVAQQCIPFPITTPAAKAKKLHAQGIAHKYADVSKLPLEKEAWNNIMDIAREIDNGEKITLAQINEWKTLGRAE